jgi:hypothetical protein
VSLPPAKANLIKAFADQRGEIHVHLEAGELAPWASEIIRPLVHRVVCSHPQSNAWIAKDADKSDRIDAFMGRFVTAESVQGGAWRSMFRFLDIHIAVDRATALSRTAFSELPSQTQNGPAANLS